MWHASVSSNVLDSGRLVDQAYRMLAGVGDASLGEWEDLSPRGVFHLRRRLTPGEAALAGPVRDIRSTPEADQRIQRLARHVPFSVADLYRLEGLAP